MPFGLSEAVIEDIRAILRRYPEVEKVVLYGSRAKGNYKNGSDIDLTLFGDMLTYQHVFNISNDLDDSFIPHTVDVSIFARISNPKLCDHIERVGLIFYEKA